MRTILFLSALLSVVLSPDVTVAAERAVHAKPDFETPPVLNAADFLPPGAQMKGKGWWIEDRALCDGYNVAVIIHSGDYTLDARGPLMVQTRLHEVEAAMRLDEMKTRKAFLKGARDSASSVTRAAANAVSNPGSTLQAVPEGVGRFFERASRQVSSAVSSDSSSKKKSSKPVLNALGYDKNRRMLARDLGVDPYTTNPYLKDKLDDVALAAFAGGLGVSVLTSEVPGGNIISATGVISDLVYDRPSADLEVWIEKALKGLDVPDEAVAAFLANESYTLTLQTELARAMEKLKGVKNLPEVITLANGVKGEEQARFIVAATRMLADEHPAMRFKALRVAASVSGITEGGELIAPAPVDYLCWTERLASMAGNAELRNYKRILLVYGKLSPRAAAEFKSSGWQLRTYLLKPDPKSN